MVFYFRSFVMIENGMVVDSYWNDDEETEEQYEAREAEREYYDFNGRG